MTTQVLHFVELSDHARGQAEALGKLASGDRIELHVKRGAGDDQTVSLPPEAAALDVGKHRRTTLKDVLALKHRIDAQRTGMAALADDAEDLKLAYSI